LPDDRNPRGSLSVQEQVSRLGDVEFWLPYIAEILKRHDLADAARERWPGSIRLTQTFV